MTEETEIVGPLRRVAIVKHGEHIGQEARPGEIGGSQPGFTHADAEDEEGNSVGDWMTVDGSAWGLGDEDEVIVELLSYDPEEEAWTVEVVSGPGRENTLELGVFDMENISQNRMKTWTLNNPAALENRAREIFPLTEDWAEAGYILTDGDMLDFSGKIEGGSPGMRSLDHRDIQRAFIDGDGADDPEGRGSSTDNMIWFLQQTEAIRVSYQGTIGDATTSLDIYSKPTGRQWSVINEMIEFSSGFVADINDENGNVVWDISAGEFDKEASLRELRFQTATRFEERSMIRMTLRHGKHVDQEGREDKARGAEFRKTATEIHKAFPADIRKAIDGFMASLRTLFS